MYARRVWLIRGKETRDLSCDSAALDLYFKAHSDDWALAMESLERDFTCSVSGDGGFVVTAGTPGSSVGWFAADPVGRESWRGDEFSWPTPGGAVTVPTYVRLDSRLAQIVAKQWFSDGSLSPCAEWVDLM